MWAQIEDAKSQVDNLLLDFFFSGFVSDSEFFIICNVVAFLWDCVFPFIFNIFSPQRHWRILAHCGVHAPTRVACLAYLVVFAPYACPVKYWYYVTYTSKCPPLPPQYFLNALLLNPESGRLITTVHLPTWSATQCEVLLYAASLETKPRARLPCASFIFCYANLEGR